MATRTATFGAHRQYIDNYDDATNPYFIDADGEAQFGQLMLQDAPTDPSHTARLQDITGVVSSGSVTVSSAEILALNTTPKTLVAAPAAGSVHEFQGAVLVLDHGGSDYATNGDLVVRYTNGAGTIVSTTVAAASFLQQTGDTIYTLKPIATDHAMTSAAALVLHCLTGDPTAGNGAVRVYLRYRTVATGL